MAYEKIKRIKLITWTCVVGFLLVILSLPQVFSPETRRLGDFYPAVFALLISLRFIAFVGVWHMKKWGVELFMLTLAVQVILATLIESYTINRIALGIHIALLIAMIATYRKMDTNL